MNVPCNEDCKHYKEAKENPDSLEPSWKWAFERYDFVVPKAETRWFKCAIEGCDGNKQENWQRLNREVMPEFCICHSCGQQLKQVKIEKSGNPDDPHRKSQKLGPCTECGSNEWSTDFNRDVVFCVFCGIEDADRTEEHRLSKTAEPIIAAPEETYSKEEKADLRLNPHLRKLLKQSKNRASSMKMSIEEQRDIHDLITVNRIISGGNSERLESILEGCEIDRERWPEIAKEVYGRGVANLPPRYCQCRKSKRNPGRPRMILHLHQILQSKGNVQSISEMLKLAAIHPKHFHRFINFGPVGNHLPNQKLIEGQYFLRSVAERLIEPIESLEPDNLLYDEIEKEFTALDDSDQFILSSNLENGLWSFNKNRQPSSRDNGHIIMIIPYAIAITRAIRSIHGPRFRNFIRGLGEKAMADAQFTKGELVPESGWD